MSYSDPAATSVIPFPPPVIVSVVPATIVSLPALLNDGTVNTSPEAFISNVAPALFVNVPLTLTVLLPPEKPVSNCPELFTFPVSVSLDPPSTPKTPPLAIVAFPLSVTFDPVATFDALPPLNCPLPLPANVPPFGVTVLVCPF